MADRIISNIKDYLTNVLATKGTRKTLAQQAYRTVVAACSGANLVEARLLRKTCTLLGVHWRNIARGVADRSALQEKKGTGFVECTRKEYRNKMPDQVFGEIHNFKLTLYT